jgi:hypothetical protein
MTYPDGKEATQMMDGTATTGWAIGVTRTFSAASASSTGQTDSTASLREEMGIQDPNGALTMDELLDHKGPVWVVLKQHSKSANKLLVVFGCPVNAKVYAKTHRGSRSGATWSWKCLKERKGIAATTQNSILCSTWSTGKCDGLSLNTRA